jgi:ActR/RegA family two-component response regulator
MSTRRYVAAMRFFPFDSSVWPALTHALQRQGRESDYLGLVRPIADSVTRSRHIAGWIAKGEAGAASLDAMRTALADSLAIMHLGFAEADGIEQLERGLAELRTRRAAVAEQLAALSGVAMDRRGPEEPAAVPASLDAAPGPVDRVAVKRRRAELSALLEEIDRQVNARARALPLYRNVVDSPELAPELRVRRDHPVHTLLRRMYHENRS